MALPVPCTLAQANAEFDRTVSYRADGTGQLATDFLAVCGWLMGRRALESESTQVSDARFKTVYANLEGLMQQCQNWLASNVNVGAASEATRLQNQFNLPRQFGLANIRDGGCY